MNRELKLALIVGFSLVLVVAVLISDHLSSARKAAMANLVNDLPSAVSSGSITGPGEIRVPGQGTPTTGSSLTPPANPMGELQNPATPPSETELVAANTPGADPFGGAGLGSGGLGLGGLTGGGSASTPVPEPLVIRQGSGLGSGLGSGPVTSLHNSDQAPVGSSDPLTGPGVSVDPTARPSEPVRDFSKDRRHAVARGDSLIAISRRYYGDSSLHKALAEYNKGRVGSDGTSLREGVTLFIPDRHVLTGEPAPKAEARTEARPEPVRAPARPEARPETVRTYTVKRGDSLAKIAQAQLGSSRRVADLLKLNGLSDPDDIKIGQVLKLPAR